MSKVISTNIGDKVTIIHNHKEISTGIYKYPQGDPIFLGKTDVAKDSVVDRRYHGGVDKACYLYPSENYAYWKSTFPQLDFEWGMFGENITTIGLQESEVKIGSVYQIGEALVQVTQPRQPCFKLGIRMENASAVKLFSNSPYPGIYVRVLSEGHVKTNDSIELVEEGEQLTLTDVFALLMKRNSNKELARQSYHNKFLAQSAKNDLLKIFGESIV